jgi:hypothetical protein
VTVVCGIFTYHRSTMADEDIMGLDMQDYEAPRDERTPSDFRCGFQALIEGKAE